MGNIEIGALSQQEAEKLLRECREIATNWERYLQFYRKRKHLLNNHFPTEGLN